MFIKCNDGTVVTFLEVLAFRDTHEYLQRKVSDVWDLLQKNTERENMGRDTDETRKAMSELLNLGELGSS